MDRVPVLSVTQTGTVELMKMCGAYWPEAHIKSEAMATLALAAYEIAGFEAVRVPFGMYAEAETLGCKIEYHKERNDFTPTVSEPVKDLSNLPSAEPTEGRMAVVVNAVKIIKDKLNGDVPIIAAVVGPFTLSGMLIGVDKQMRDLITDPEKVHEITKFSTDIVVKFGKVLIEAGADVISILEPTSSTIGPKFFKEFGLSYLQTLTSNLKGLTVLHVCGNSLPIMNLMIETGINGISIDQKVDVKKAREIAEGKTSVIGNVDPVTVLLDGKPEDVTASCKKIIEDGINVLAPGCGLSPYTSIINMRAMVETAKEYFKR